MMEGTYVGGAEEPFALGAVFDCYAGEGDILLGLVLGGWRGVFDWGCWFCHFPSCYRLVGIDVYK